MRTGLTFVIGAFCLSMLGCAANADDGKEDPANEEVGITDSAVHTFRFTVFPDPYANGTANPAAGIRGIANGYVAKNPKAVFRRKPKLDFAVWDERPDSLAAAQQIMASAAVAMAPPSASIMRPRYIRPVSASLWPR
mgnify:CR=1 FL=1